MDDSQVVTSTQWLQVGGLRMPFAEGQEALEALRTGAVDALVVEGTAGSDVFVLRGADHSYRTLVECMNEGALILTTDGDIVYANPPYAALVEQDSSDIKGRPLSHHVAEGDRARLESMLQRALTTRVREEIELVRADGGKLPVSASLNLLQLNETEGLCAVITDLSEQKRTEAAMAALERQRIQMEQLAAAGRMAARVAHEINNPLAGIKNAFVLIRNAVPADHPHAHYVPRVQTEIDRLASIVHQMFELCRPDAADERQSLAAIVEDVMFMQELSSRKRSISLRLDLDEGSRLAMAPSQSLHQILHNLVQNAFDASPEDGVITLRACEAIAGWDGCSDEKGCTATRAGSNRSERLTRGGSWAGAGACTGPAPGVFPPAFSSLAGP